MPVEIDFGVYAIRNTVNGKAYVGSAAMSLQRRKWTHWSKLKHNVHHNKHLQAAWNKYGKGAFEFVVLERCERELCVEREQWWIDEKRAADCRFGYNGRPTASSNLGKKVSAETKAKMSASAKLACARPEVKERKRQAVMRPGEREKRVERAKELWSDPAHRERAAEGARKRFAKPEEREKVSEANRKRFANAEARAKCSASARRRYANPEEREQISRQQREKWADPEYRDKMSAIRRRTLGTPEARKRSSERVRAQWANPEFRARMLAALEAGKAKAAAMRST